MWKNECKKFKPNIFNKNKCANCYRDREQHSDEALEVNKATRIVSKCGYLFVAPNWDFTNPVYRTKRWQRRWFVLYDDGELTYSVDDHYDTIPQAIINLNNVFEITEADAITGNENSIAIVANDGIHFCKGTCREESRMWLDILRLFPQATVMGQGRTTGNGGRAKRSATFPGMRNLGTNFMSPASRFANNKNAAIQANKNTNEDLDDDTMDGLEDEDDLEDEVEEENENEKRPSIIVEKPPLTPISTTKSSILRRSSDRFNHRRSSSSTRLNDDKNEDVPPTPPNTSPPASPYNPVKTCKSPMTARPPPSPNQAALPPTSKTSTASITLHSPVSMNSTSTSPTPPTQSRRASYHKPTLSSEYKRMTNDNLDSITRPRRPSSGSSTPLLPSRGSSYLGLAALQNRNNNGCSPMLQKKDSISSTESLSPSPSESRGTPDGCGLDLVNSSPELLTKKGWLMKQGLTKEWHKYWFVLQDVALQFYRDPKAESKGFLDGIIDLSLVQQVEQIDIPRNFGFAIHTFEGKNIIFSAITDGIRNNWISCLRKAANLPAEDQHPNDNLTSKPPLTKRSSSFNDAPLTITTTKIVRSSTSNALIPPKVPSSAAAVSKSLNIPKLTTTPSSSNEQEDEESEEESTDFDESDEDASDADDDHEQPSSLVEKKSEIFKEKEKKKKDEEGQVDSSIGNNGDVVVDLLETEVDSLKAKLELTQSELYTLHNSNLDLTTQLRRTQASCTSNSNKYSFTSTTSSLPMSSTLSSVSSSSISNNGTKSSPVSYEKSSYLEEELTKTQKELAKQTSEILSLKNQLSLKQITLQQHLQAIEDVTKDRDDALKKLDKTCLKLEEAQAKIELKESEVKQSNARCQDLQNRQDSMDKEVHKWKRLYESLYLQYDNELHTWEDSLKKLEKQRDERECTHGEEIRRKDRVVSDLSEQLKESEDRIQELQIDLEACKDTNDALKHHSEESFSRLVVSMEEKFEETLKAEKEQMETAFKLKAKELKDHDLYDRLAASSSPMSTRANSRRASLVKISSMSDLLTLKAPTLENLEVMTSEQVKQKFIVLIDHFYAAVDEIRALRARLSKAQDQIDAMEIDKIRFEETFKRTIVMQEQQENLMSKRIQDLTNKLQVSEKTVRQLKERKHSRRHSIKHQNATQSDSGTTDT